MRHPCGRHTTAELFAQRAETEERRPKHVSPRRRGRGAGRPRRNALRGATGPPAGRRSLPTPHSPPHPLPPPIGLSGGE
eukprot:scaffold37432_cov124-Isochrysis_galbana.AAC.2